MDWLIAMAGVATSITGAYIVLLGLNAMHGSDRPSWTSIVVYLTGILAVLAGCYLFFEVGGVAPTVPMCPC